MEGFAELQTIFRSHVNFPNIFYAVFTSEEELTAGFSFEN